MTLLNLQKNDLKEYYPIFDFDNTIINELDYIFPIFEESLTESNFNGQQIGQLKQTFLDTYKHRGSLKIIDHTLKGHDHPLDFLEIYLNNLRKHRSLENKLACNLVFIEFVNSIYFTPDTVHIISNGNTKQQQNKFRNTDFTPLKKEIKFHCAADYQPKPDPLSFKSIFSEKNKYLYIGDSDIDCEFAKNSGIDFLNIEKLESLLDSWFRWLIVC